MRLRQRGVGNGRGRQRSRSLADFGVDRREPIRWRCGGRSRLWRAEGSLRRLPVLERLPVLGSGIRAMWPRRSAARWSTGVGKRPRRRRRHHGCIGARRLPPSSRWLRGVGTTCGPGTLERRLEVWCRHPTRCRDRPLPRPVGPRQPMLGWDRLGGSRRVPPVRRRCDRRLPTVGRRGRTRAGRRPRGQGIRDWPRGLRCDRPRQRRGRRVDGRRPPAGPIGSLDPETRGVRRVCRCWSEGGGRVRRHRGGSIASRDDGIAGRRPARPGYRSRCNRLHGVCRPPAVGAPPVGSHAVDWR